MNQPLTKRVEQHLKDSKNWKGIPESLKFSLLSMIDIVRINCSAIKQLQKQIAYKANKNELLSMMGSKLSISEFSTMFDRFSNEPKIINKIQKMQSELQSKMVNNNKVECCFNLKEYQLKLNWIQKSIQGMKLESLEEIRRIEQALLKKADRIEIQNICMLNQTFDKELEQMNKGLQELSRNPYPDLKSVFEKIEHKIQNLDDTLTELTSKHKNNQKINFTPFDKQTKIRLDCLSENVESFRKQLVEIDKRTRNTLSMEFNEAQEKLAQKIYSLENAQKLQHSCLKLQIQELEKPTAQVVNGVIKIGNIERSLTDLYQRNAEIDRQCKQFQLTLQDLISSQQILETKMGSELTARLSNLQEYAQTKLDSEKFDLELDNLVYRGQLQQEVEEVSQKYSILIEKIDCLREEFHNFKINESKLNQSFSCAIDNKLAFNDVKKIIQEFVTVEDIKLLVGDIDKKINQLMPPENTYRFINDQAAINETLCAQNIVARWFWRTGELKNGNLVPWEKQIINTLPENFIWEELSTSITISNGGLYKIELGFYSKKKPSIQILINGNSILSAVNNNSYVIHHSSGKLKDSKSNNISGLTLVDYFLVPSRSRLAVSYVGETGQGFLSLKRL